MSIMQLPADMQTLIAHQCDEKTLAAFGGSCSTLRHFYTNLWMSERVAARRVFYTPSLYPQLDESMKRKRSVALNALTMAPDLIESAATPVSIQQNVEMRKTALVASYFLRNQDLYQTLKAYPDLTAVALELEKPSKRISQNSELWSLQPYVFYSPVVSYKNIPEELANHIDIALENIKQRKVELDALPRRLRRNEEVTDLFLRTVRRSTFVATRKKKGGGRHGRIPVIPRYERKRQETEQKTNHLYLRGQKKEAPVLF